MHKPDSESLKLKVLKAIQLNSYCFGKYSAALLSKCISEIYDTIKITISYIVRFIELKVYLLL